MSHSSTRPWKHALWSVLFVFGCSTPSVPIPPPQLDLTALTFSAPAIGKLVLTGMPAAAHEDAELYVIDQADGDGVITRAAADGSFTTPAFAANVGDSIQLQLTVPDGRQSAFTCVGVVLDGPLVEQPCK